MFLQPLESEIKNTGDLMNKTKFKIKTNGTAGIFLCYGNKEIW